MADARAEEFNELNESPNIHSFVIRLWQESMLNGANGTIWRGHVTHIPGGEKRYITGLKDIHEFIEAFLGESR